MNLRLNFSDHDVLLQASSSARTSEVNVEVEFLFDFKVTVSTDLFLH